jgi:hypothetical protein
MRIAAFNRCTIATMAFAAGVMAATAPAAGQDLGAEWKSLTALEWKIVLPIPELKGLIERHQLRANAESSYDHEIAFWSGSASPYPRAVLHYLKTHAEMSWRTTPDPRSVKDEGVFKEKGIKFGSLNKDRNRLSRAQWRTFHFDDVTCVSFAQTWGMDVDQRLAGDNMIFGYYCAEPGQPLPEDSARKVVMAIDIADTKDRRRQLANKSTGPFAGFWTGTGSRESGNCKVGGYSYGRLESVQIELMIRELEITGRVTRGRHSYDGPFVVNAAIRGTVSGNGEFVLQVGKTYLGAELTLRGKLPKDGDKARGEWDTPNCHGKLSLTRKY